jgi:hypothetical protein
MTRRSAPRRTAIAAALFSLSSALGPPRVAWAAGLKAPAAGPKTAECLAASEASLKSAADHKLRAELSQLLVCAAPTCPKDIRKECEGRVDEVTQQIPTIIFAAKNGSGGDLSAVKVTMDGEVLAPKLDGTALSVDPGEHKFTFEVAGQPPVDKTLVLHEGEKDRREKMVLVHRGRLTVRAGPNDAIALDGQSLATGTWEGEVDSGGHTLRVTAPGMVAYQSEVSAQDGESRTIDVKLNPEPTRGVLPMWAWIAGGVVVAAGATVGGYFLFKSPGTTTVPVPAGTLGGVQLSSVRW